MRPSIRFEVFKRDGFTCQYCGRKPPDVVLEADHIVPRIAGGTDDLENLVTACWDCNRGKGAGLLDDIPPALDIAAQTELVREREAQLRAYHAATAEALNRRDSGYVEAMAHWHSLYNDEPLQRWELPWQNAVRGALDSFGIAGVKHAMTLAVEATSTPNQAAKYFGGILRKWRSGEGWPV